MDSLTAEHRSKQLLLRRQTISQTSMLMPLLSWDDLDGSYERLKRALQPVVARNLRTSSSLASTYVRRFRAKSGPSGAIDPVRASLDVDQFGASLRVTSVVAAKKAASRGLAAELALGHVETLVAGAMARLVLNGGRDTVTASLRNDSAARGWQRVLGGGGCEFCQMLAGRGEVYSADTADFEAHDRCGCTAEPVYA